MAKIGYFNNATDDTGAPRAATITVYNAGTAVLASIWSDAGGTIVKDNPFITDVLGRFQFFASPGAYDVEVSGTGITTYKIEYEQLSNITKTTELTDMPASLVGQAKKLIKVKNTEDGYEHFEQGWEDVRNYASFSAAIDAIGAAEKTLLIPNEQDVLANKTVPSNVTLKFLQGGSLDIANGVTVTINGHIDADLYQIFKWTGTGKVVLGVGGSVSELYPQWWGAKSDDGLTDDTVAIQAAVDACLALATRPLVLMITGKCRLTAPIIIDRLVDTCVNKGAFRIVGLGKTAGFYVSTAIDMFSSSLVDALHPPSEAISFESIQFEGSLAALAAYVLDGEKFLRIQFLDCRFYRMHCLTSTIYTQSIYFTKCAIRQWGGTFYNAFAAYDLSFEGCLIELGENFLAVSNLTRELRFTNNCLEGCTGIPFRLTECKGTFMAGNYFESNAGASPYVDFGIAKGVVLSGNSFILTAGQAADPAYFAVAWGNTYGAISVGNYCYGHLYANPTASSPSSFFSAGDYLLPVKIVGLPIYANNAAALVGGLTIGAFYRTNADPDLVCVVH